MEMEITGEAVGAPGALSPTWYVALMQLPAVPRSVRAAGIESIHEGLGRLPVASRRDHAWHSLHATLDAAPEVLGESQNGAGVQDAPALA
jgi:hypothetical protein